MIRKPFWIYVILFTLYIFYEVYRDRSKEELAYKQQYSTPTLPKPLEKIIDVDTFKNYTDTTKIIYDTVVNSVITPQDSLISAAEKALSDAKVVDIKPAIVSSGGSIYNGGIIDDNCFPKIPSSINSNSFGGVDKIQELAPLPSLKEIDELTRLNKYNHKEYFFDNPINTNTNTNINTDIDYNTNPNTLNVRGYYKSNGTYVAPYVRTAPNSSISDNINYNPNTGKVRRRKY